MEIKEALLIGDLTEGTVIAGRKGVSREISSIEVMEVPEVLSWVTPGILVMTVFYSIKDDPNKQTEIVQSLIDKRAAGIVIKLGRFINSIPDQMIELANENSFPIISIPKNISYINVLTPLYEKLYLEKQQEEQRYSNPFYEFEKFNFPFLSDAIEKISEILNSPIYIEDLEGRILYVSEDFQSDGWRKSATLFSKPDYPFHVKKLEEWRIEFLNKSHTQLKIQDFRNQVIIPLISKNKLFAIVHMQYTDNKDKEITSSHMKEMGNRLSELFINEQLYLQKNRLDDMDLKEQYLGELDNMETNKVVTIVHFKANWLGSHYPTLYLIDHSCLIRKKLNYFVKQFSDCKTLIFEKYHNFYALMYGEKWDNPTMVRKWHELIHRHNENNNTDPLRVSISSSMNNAKYFEDRVRSVIKTMEIGCRVKPEETVYTADKLGIYEILMKLTSDKFVRKYTEDVLSTLQVENNDLMETLEVFLNENGNVSKASDKLFIHRRTTAYRLEKIQGLLNMDLNDSNNRFILHFCLKIKDLS